jgi:hypothetical protein
MFVTINISNHSPKLAKKLGLILSNSSMCVYTWKIFVFSAKVVIRVGNHRAFAGTGIPYISWLRKFPILQSIIPNGAIDSILSALRRKSLKDSLSIHA